MSLTRRELTKGGLASLGFLALPGGIFVAPPHWVPKGRITEIEIPVAELPAGKNLTIAIRPISSLGTKGKSIGTTIRV